jgi:hypothetical protein
MPADFLQNSPSVSKVNNSADSENFKLLAGRFHRGKLRLFYYTSVVFRTQRNVTYARLQILKTLNCPVNFDVSHTLCVFVKEAVVDLRPFCFPVRHDSGVFYLLFATYRLGHFVATLCSYILMSVAKPQPERTFVLGVDIKCRLYSCNSFADLAKSTAAKYLVAQFNGNACNCRAGLHKHFREANRGENSTLQGRHKMQNAGVVFMCLPRL